MLVLRQDLQERLGRQVLSNLFKMCMNGGTYQSFETLLIASQFDSVMLAAFAEGGGILLMSFNDAFDCCVDAWCQASRNKNSCAQRVVPNLTFGGASHG